MLRHTVPSQAAGGGGRRGGGGEDVLFLHVLLSPPSVRASERGSEGCDRRKDEAWAQDRQDRGALSLARSLARSLSFILARSPSFSPSLPRARAAFEFEHVVTVRARSLARSLVLSPPPLLSGSRNARLETPLAAVGRAALKTG